MLFFCNFCCRSGVFILKTRDFFLFAGNQNPSPFMNHRSFDIIFAAWLTKAASLLSRFWIQATGNKPCDPSATFMSKTHSRRAHSLPCAGITVILCVLALPEARGQNEFTTYTGGDFDGATTWLDYDSDGNSLGTYSQLGERVFTNTGYQYRAASPFVFSGGDFNTNGDYTASSNPSTLLYDYNLDVSGYATFNIAHDLSTSATDTNTGQLSMGGPINGGTINHTAGTLTTGTLHIGDHAIYSSLWPEISEYHISGTADIDASSITIERGRLFVGDGVTLDESITVTASSIEGSGTTTGGTLTGQITLGTYPLEGEWHLKRFTGNNMTLSGGIVSSNNQNLAIEGKNYTIDTNAINLNSGTMLFWGADNDKANATQLNVAGNNWELAQIARGGYLLAGAENVMDSGAGLKFGQYSGYDTSGVNGSGTFDLNGYDQTVAYLQSSHAGDDHTITDTSGNGASLTVDYSGTDIMKYYGRFEGDVGLTKEGSGTLFLENQSGTDNTHTGVIRINGGTLEISSNDALGSTAAGTIIGDAELQFASGSGLTIDENITSSGSGQASIRGGNHNGLITLNAGLTLNDGTYNGGITSLDQDLTISGAVINTAIDLDSDNSGAAGNLIIREGSSSQLVVGGNKVGALQFTSTGDYDNTTRLTIQTAEKILQGSAGIEVVGAHDNVVILDLNGFDQTIHHISVDEEAAGFWVSSPNSSPATLTFNAEDDREYRGHFDGATNITKEGAGTLHFSASYLRNIETDGVIRVNEGTLKIDSWSGLGTNVGETIIANGATLNAVGGFSDNVINDGTITLTGDRSSSPRTVAGAISGSGSLVKTSGQSAYTLTGVNTYTGGTWVESNGGELRGTTDSLQGAIYNSGAVGILQDFDGTFNGTVTGTGSFRVRGGVGTNTIITLNGNLTHTGDLRVDRGTLVVTTDNLQRNITVGFSGEAALRFDQDFDGTYNSVIDGNDYYNPGSVEKYGTGTVTFAAKQNYIGGTTVNEGTLRIIKSATADGTSVTRYNQYGDYIVAEGATLKFNQTGGTTGLGLINVSGNGTFKTSGTVELVHTSAGSSVALGSGALFHVESGIYRFGGVGLGDWSSNLSDMQIDSGATFDGAATPTVVDSLNGAGTLKTGGGITFGADNGDGTFSGNIKNSSHGSAKSLTKTGSGTQILNGTANHTGTTTVNEGTLSLGSGYSHNGGGAFAVNAAGTLEGTTDNLQGADITNNGNVRLNQSTDGTYSDAMSGTGSLEKSGTGIVTLSGTNTYSGGTILNAGALIGTTDSLQGAITNNGSIHFDQSTDGSYSGTMGGSGSLEKSGTGTLTLSGNSSYTGTTTVNGGTLSLGSDHTHSGGGAFVVNAAGTLEGTTDNLQGAAITNNGNVRFNQSADGTYSDTLSGTGSLEKSGTGTVTLSGTSNYTGTTTVNSGTLSLGSGYSHSGGGAFVVNAGTLAGTTDNLQGAIANDGTVRFDQSSNGSYSGAMSGTGSLEKSGTGTLTLSGTNTYSGTTTVNGGTLSLGSGYSHSGGGAFVVNAGTLAGTTDNLQGRAITNDGNVRFNQSTDGTYSDAMSGTGSLEKSGTGTVTLSGTNTYSGGTTVNAGALIGTTDSLQGAITNDGNVRFNQSTEGTYSGAMSGTGSLEKSGTGTLILSGTNTYSGATTVNAGTLRMINSASGDGINGNTASAINYSVASGATLEFSRTGGTLDIGKIDLSGGGTFKKTGSEEISHTSADSTVALGSGALFHVESGTYRFGAGTAGTWSSNLSDMQIDSGATFNGAATAIVVDSLSGAGSLKTGGGITVGADNGDGTFSGNIENSGYGSTFSFTKNGTGTQTLSGTSTYSGGTTVNGGTLAGTTDSLQGAIANDANVRFDQSTDGTYSGAMSGTGSLEKSGTGTVIMTGTNSHSGATTVNAGTLRMINSASGNGINKNTASASSYSIASGATLEFSRTSGTLYIGKIDLSGGGTFKKTGSEEISHTSADSTVALGSGALFHVESGIYSFGAGTAGTWSSNLSDIQIDSGATFNGATTAIVVDSLNGAGSLIIGGGITVGADNGGGTFSGNIEDSSSWGSTFSFTKNGTGTQTLSGTNTYSGTTEINDGTLVVNGTNSGGGAMTININGTLAGSGSITGDIDVLGTISPGNSPGTLTQTGDQTWNDGGSYHWEINDSDGTKGSDPGWDWLDITGTLDLANLSSGGFTIDIDSLTTSNAAGDADGFDTYIKDGDIADYSFVIATASGGITGFEAGDFVLDSSGFSNSIETYYGWNWAISLSGNDLVLGASAVPEPSSTALLGLGALALALRRKRS